MKQELNLSTIRRKTFRLWPEAAQILGTGRNATYDAAKRGDIRTIRIGKRILVSENEIARLLGDPGRPAAC
jgi:excisionase family DNA binding protein